LSSKSRFLGAQLTRLGLDYNKIEIIEENAFAHLKNLVKTTHLKCLIVKLSDPSFLNYFAFEIAFDFLTSEFEIDFVQDFLLNEILVN
jgi:hypothetical protein